MVWLLIRRGRLAGACLPSDDFLWGSFWSTVPQYRDCPKSTLSLLRSCRQKDRFCIRHGMFGHYSIELCRADSSTLLWIWDDLIDFRWERWTCLDSYWKLQDLLWKILYLKVSPRSLDPHFWGEYGKQLPNEAEIVSDLVDHIKHLGGVASTRDVAEFLAQKPDHSKVIYAEKRTLQQFCRNHSDLWQDSFFSSQLCLSLIFCSFWWALDWWSMDNFLWTSISYWIMA